MFKVYRGFIFLALFTLFLAIINPGFITTSLAGTPVNEGKKPDQQITPVRVADVEKNAFKSLSKINWKN